METNDYIIDVSDVSMRFNLAKEITDSIKEYILKMISRKLNFQEFYALKNISFKVKRGEAVALIGKNGSGKSTMLKILAGVMYPTTGHVSVRGSVAPLIELGAGFDMELTARENTHAHCFAPNTHSPGSSLALVFPKISIHPQRRQLGRFRRSKRQVGARGEAKPCPLPRSALKAPGWVRAVSSGPRTSAGQRTGPTAAWVSWETYRSD